MPHTMQVTCFADIKKSTSLTERLGNQRFSHYRGEFLVVGKQLAINCNGNYVKNTGDGHLVTFTNLDDSFRFAAHLQQFYSERPCYNLPFLRIRIGMFLGTIEITNDDVFGSGVNQAARVEGQSQPNEIWINKDLFSNISKVWSKRKAKKYLTYKGKFKLKGINPKQELFSFDWVSYVRDFPDEGLQKLVFDHLENADVVLSNFTVADMSTPNYVIWPVVPRDIVNAIHRGQLEIIRLLAILGWHVRVLIADCGATNSTPKRYSIKFQREISRYAKLRSMRNFDFSFLSDLYKPGANNCPKRHEFFRKVISDLTLENMMKINSKSYPKSIQQTIKDAATLDFLKPALVIAEVLNVSKSLQCKCVVISGEDERILYESTNLNIPDSRKQLGALFNPILTSAKGYQERQNKNWPQWDSWDSMVNEMKSTNLMEWTTKLHAYIPAFPSQNLKIGDVEIGPSDLDKKNLRKKKINQESLAKHVFEKILGI